MSAGRELRSRHPVAAHDKQISADSSSPATPALQETPKNTDKKFQIPAAETSRILRLFNQSYDDSSDEEDTEQEFSQYQIAERWKQKLQLSTKNQKIKIEKDILASNELLSFVAHVAGSKLLHHQEINKIYYPLRAVILREKSDAENAVSQLQRLVKEALLDAINAAFAAVKIFLDMTRQAKYLSRFDKDKEKILAEFSSEFEKIIEPTLAAIIHYLKSSKFRNDYDLDELQPFEMEVRDLLLKIFREQYGFIRTDCERNQTKEELFELAKENVNEIFNKLKIYNKEHLQGKEEAIKSLEKIKGKSSYKRLLEETISLLQMAPARGYVLSMIQNEINKDIPKQRFIHAYVEDLRGQNTALAADLKLLLKKYFSFHSESLCDEFESAFSIAAHQNLYAAIKAFNRPVLAPQHAFSSQNPYQFYANLRLANRSQKRQIVNLQNATIQSCHNMRSWSLAKSSMQNIEAIEVQEILPTSLGRRDMVKNLGNYPKIYEEIQQIKNLLNGDEDRVTDKTIAEWIREIFKGSAPEFNYAIPMIDKQIILQRMQSIAYLIFGCEATRNPAMLVVNQMLLDLIIANKWNFEEAFAGSLNDEDPKLMPMAPENAVSIARGLESHYRKFMPKSYYYPGIENNETKKTLDMPGLIALEARVLRDWVQAKSRNMPKRAAGMKDNEYSAQIAAWLLEKIRAYFKNWLGPLSALPENADANLEEEMARLSVK